MRCQDGVSCCCAVVVCVENGSGNPTIKILKRLAEGLGMNLKIEFTPKSQFAKN